MRRPVARHRRFFCVKNEVMSVSLVSSPVDDGFAPHVAQLSALAPEAVLTDPDLYGSRLTDWRGAMTGTTPFVLAPRDVETAARLIKYCADHRLPIVPQGGNTGLVGGGIPQGEILLSTEKMKAIRALDADNNSAIVEAGVTLADLRAAAASIDRQFPMSLGSQGSATIGGLASTNAGGVQVLRHGMMRDLVFGVEAVLPDGRIFRGLHGLRKNNVGYDLKHLFLGAEGTLGLITAVSVKLAPIPRSTAAAFIATPTIASAVALLNLARDLSGDAVSAFELMPDIGLDLVCRHIPGATRPLPNAKAPWWVLMELSYGRDDGVEDALEAILMEASDRHLTLDAAIARNEAQAKAFWRIRETLPEAEKKHARAVKHDVSTPISALDSFYREATAAISARWPQAQIIAFGHVGDGNLHYNVSARAPAEAQSLLKDSKAIQDVVYDCVIRHHGSISAEHGIGILKKDALKSRADPVALALMRSIKAAIDPHNLFNPGRLIDV